MIQRYNTDVLVHELVFTKALFWVQVHEILVHYMTKTVAESLCEIVGEVQKSTDDVDDEDGHFIRVRVLIDVTLPLCRGRLITMENGVKNWIRFKYERLPNICFWCGRLTHSDKNCDLWIDNKGTLSPDQQQFNSSLKASPYSAKGKNVIFVPKGSMKEENPVFRYHRKSGHIRSRWWIKHGLVHRKMCSPTWS